MSVDRADYESASEARKEFRLVLDAAERGRAVTIQRHAALSAVLPADRLREHFFATVDPGAKVFFEEGAWVVILENLPFVSEGKTVDDAVADLVLSLREYAEDWDSHLRMAPNHEQNWALVQLVNLSTDQQLADWIELGGE